MAKADEPTTKYNLVVVVDDDQAVRDSLRFSFAIEGFAVCAFASAQQLLAETSLPAGDCFIVDQKMPGMSGLDLISTLRARNLTAPAILITTHPSAELRNRAAAAGVPIVEKPFLDFTLLESVRRSLAQGAESNRASLNTHQQMRERHD